MGRVIIVVHLKRGKYFNEDRVNTGHQRSRVGLLDNNDQYGALFHVHMFQQLLVE